MASNRNARNKIRVAIVAATLGLTLSVPAALADAYSAQEMASVRTADENKIRELRNQEIEELRRTLGRRLPLNRRADLYVRLAETYLEAYRFEFLNEGKVHEKRLAEGVPDKFIDRTNSKPYIRLGIRACEEVLKLGIKHPKLDEIYYFLGVYNDELENEKEAVKWFKQLTQRFPSSPYAGEAYRAIAESYFMQANFKEALRYYEVALPRYQGNALPRLLQKKAWSHYRMKQYDRAVSTMKTAIAEASKDDRFLNVKDEALRDMAIFMTESGRVDEALGYFRQAAGDKEFYPRALERLGAQYERNAEMAKATQVYEALLKSNTNPEDESAFRVRVKLVQLDLRRSRYAQALKRIQGVAVPSRFEDSDTEIAARNLRALTRKTAVDAHDSYRKTQDKKGDLVVAENFYTVYLNQFLAKDDPKKETPEIQMYLAEVKRDLGKPQDAAFLYKQVIQSKDERYAKQAAAFWMSSLGETIAKAKKGEKKDGEDAELKGYEKDFIEASDYVAENFGTKAEGLQARLNVIVALAANPSKLDETEDRIEDLIKLAPGSQQALTAAKLRAQLYSDRLPKNPAEIQGSKQAERLLEVMNEYRGNAALMEADKRLQKGALAATFDAEETRIKIGVLAGQEKAKDFAAAGKGYEDFANREEKRELAEKAYENAVANYVRMQDYDSATRVIGKWTARYKDTRRGAEMLRDVATNAIIMGRFEKAGALFRILGKAGDPNALEVAGRLFEGAGDLTEAAQDFRWYLERFKKGANRGQVALSLAQWYEYSKSDTNAIKYLKLCFDENNETSAECGARLAELYQRLEQPGPMRRYFTLVAQRGGSKKRKGDDSPWVGYARYQIATAIERDANFRKLTLPDDKLKRGLEERLKFLAKLNDSYQTVVEVAGPWAVAALDRLATWVMAFADEVDQIEAPKGASPEAMAGFRKSLKTVSDPLRQKAIETWRTAYQKAAERELLSPVLPSIADRLADLGAQTPSRAQGFRDKYRLSGQPADGGKEGRGNAFERVRRQLIDNAKDAVSWIDYGNLLWGDGKPLLAKIAYERALLLNPKAAAALNNRGVLIVSGSGQEDWIRVAEGNQYFKQAIERDELFLAAKFNRGAILNYYRLFAKARPYWTQVAAVAPQPDVIDGIAVSEQGQGSFEAAEKTFARATKAGAASGRPSAVYHQAARMAKSDPSKCARLASGLLDETTGFERQAAEHLNGVCTEAKSRK